MKNIALYTRHPHCSLQCCNGVISSLFPEYYVTLFNEGQVEPGFLDRFDCVIFPGGVGDSDKFDRFFRERRKMRLVQDYVRRGGRYIGICMGAYWADKDYFNIVRGIRVQQYIKRPRTDTRRPHAKAIDVIWQNMPTKMYFYDGCAMIGNEQDFEVVARYRNGDPMAIIQDRIGLIGCHPESEDFWYFKPYLARHLSGRNNKPLLKSFVDRILTL